MEVHKSLSHSSTGGRYCTTPTARGWPDIRGSEGCIIFFEKRLVNASPHGCAPYGIEMRVMQKASNIWEASLILKTVPSIRTVGVCCIWYSGTFDADKAEKSYYLSHNEPFSQADKRNSSQEGNCPAHSSWCSRKFGDAIWYLWHHPHGLRQKVRIQVLCSNVCFDVRQFGYHKRVWSPNETQYESQSEISEWKKLNIISKFLNLLVLQSQDLSTIWYCIVKIFFFFGIFEIDATFEREKGNEK